MMLSCASSAYAEDIFPVGKSSVEVPFDLESGHVYVNLTINGQGPFRFIFDTGAVNVISPAAAQRLNLAVGGKVEAKGTGGTQSGGSTKVDTVRLGDLSLKNQTFYVLALPPEADQVDGLIGYEWLSHFPTRFDYAASKLTFYPKGMASQASTAQATKLHFQGKTPEVDGTVDGIPGRFSLDTGSNGSLTLFAPFVARHDLAARYRAKTRVMSAVGIGGPVYALMARAKALTFGDARVEAPVTFLSQQTTGSSARADRAGNIGYGVLHRFTILFDYPASRVYFEPNAQLDKPDLADRSGLRIESSKGAFNVVFVAENSPGMAAGLRAGDRIVAVNDVPAEQLKLADLRSKLKGEIGARVVLRLDRGDEVATVVLADL